MCRFFILFAVVFFSFGSTVFADKPPEWVFVGYSIANYAGPPKTINKIPTEYGYTWLKKDKTYSKAKKELKSSIKAANDGTYIDYSFASPSSYNFVALYQIRDAVGTWKGPELEVTKYKFYKGKTKEDITKQVSSDTEEYEYITTQPIKWFELSAPKVKQVSEVLSLEAGNAEGVETQEVACSAAIAAANQKAENECTASKQGKLMDISSSGKESIEYEIPAGQNKSVNRVEQCRGCTQSQPDGWRCTGKVTVRCNYETIVEDTGLINKMRGELQKGSNPCEEDADGAACLEYEKWQKMNRSTGARQ